MGKELTEDFEALHLRSETNDELHITLRTMDVERASSKILSKDPTARYPFQSLVSPFTLLHIKSGICVELHSEKIS
jgi:hypothetical protein